MNKFKKLTTKIGKFAAGAGVGMIVTNVAHVTAPLHATPLTKGILAVGTFVLANMATDHATKYWDEEVSKIEEELEESEETNESEN